ncbi:MAG: hypothetical protein HKN35_08435 [Woeseia sp.]|nr:hypothetical protein [Woeseia sp.]MBT8097464.1 hypothetical protein [Woeseia sp.]NNE60906.1 hypothetical protein [Woeseia sp.]NNL53936.1 hypothetical protein [Woeseia sp.]
MNNPIVYWSIAGILFIWGAAYAGLVLFSFFVSSPEHWNALVAEGRIRAEYAIYISEIPGWVIVTTVIAALTRLLGALALLLRNAWAFPFYSISLCSVVVIMFRGFVLADVASVIRTSQIVLEFAFLSISVFAVWYTFAQVNGGVLR